MATSNIVSLPFRKGTHLSLKNAIKRYISDKYDQHPDMFSDDLDVIDALRRDAVNAREAHPSGIVKLQSYAAQLVWISAKFPIDIGCDFSWYPAMGYNTDRLVIRDNIKFELINVLFNLAALYSQLALAANRLDDEGPKTAANYFMQASGVLSHIRTALIPDLRINPPDDMDDRTLESLSLLLLAQAQECFWQKAVTGGMKDAIIAKLSAQVSKLYADAGEEAVKSSAISSAWIHHMSAKHHHFAAAAQYRASCDCLEKRKYGDEVGRLKSALECVNEGLKEGKGGYCSKAVLDDLNGLKKRVEEDLKRAEKDNDILYLQHVPSKSELPKLVPTAMAQPKCPSEVSNPLEFVGEKGRFGTGLFSKLVPFAVHIAVSIYEQKRDRMVEQHVVQQLEKLTLDMQEVISSLNLPASLQALEKPLGLPSGLISHAEEIRQADALDRIPRAFQDVDNLRSGCLKAHNECMQILQAEEDDDTRCRMRYGTERWGRPASREDDKGQRIWEHVSVYLQDHLQATETSDERVRNNFARIRDRIAVLSGPDRQLMDYVPSSRRTEIPENLRPSVGRLRSAYNDVLRLQSRRLKKVEALEQRRKSDDVKADILKEAARLERAYPGTALEAGNFANFFDKRLDSRYEADVDGLVKEFEEQGKLLEALERHNRDFESNKKQAFGDAGPGGKEREVCLRSLDDAFVKYTEVIKGIDGGREFYNNLRQLQDKGRKDIDGWVAGRRMEMRALEEELSMPPLSTLSLSPSANPVPAPPPKRQPVAPVAPMEGISYSQPPQSQPQVSPQRQTRQQSRQQQVSQKYQQPLQQYQQPPPQEPPLTQSWVPPHTPQQPKPKPLAVPLSSGSMAVPHGTRWTPDIGIKFAGAGGSSSASGAALAGVDNAAGVNMGGGGGGGSGYNTRSNRTASPVKQQQQPQKKGPVGGTWDPSSGIRFG